MTQISLLTKMVKNLLQKFCPVLFDDNAAFYGLRVSLSDFFLDETMSANERQIRAKGHEWSEPR